MNYTTVFRGTFAFEGGARLTAAQCDYLHALSTTRRMKREKKGVARLSDPLREAVGLPVGRDGEFFVGGQDMEPWPGEELGGLDESDILDPNKPPGSQPSLWLQWVPTADRRGIQWDGGEGFLEYTRWLAYLSTSILMPWGLKLTGHVWYQGARTSDVGLLYTAGGKVQQLPLVQMGKRSIFGAAARNEVPMAYEGLRRPHGHIPGSSVRMVQWYDGHAGVQVDSQLAWLTKLRDGFGRNPIHVAAMLGSSRVLGWMMGQVAGAGAIPASLLCEPPRNPVEGLFPCLEDSALMSIARCAGSCDGVPPIPDISADTLQEAMLVFAERDSGVSLSVFSWLLDCGALAPGSTPDCEAALRRVLVTVPHRAWPQPHAFFQELVRRHLVSGSDLNTQLNIAQVFGEPGALPATALERAMAVVGYRGLLVEALVAQGSLLPASMGSPPPAYREAVMRGLRKRRRLVLLVLQRRAQAVSEPLGRLDEGLLRRLVAEAALVL